MKVLVTYANIQNGGQDSSRQEVRHASEIVAEKRWGRKPDFILLNEIKEVDDKQDVVDGVGKRYQPAHLMQTPNPIFRKRMRWAEEGRDRVMLSPVFPGENPARWLTMVSADCRWPWGPDPDVIDIHFTNGAWNNEHARTKMERRHRWMDEDAQTDDVVDHRVTLGKPIVIAGDWNKKAVQRYRPDMRWAIKHGIIAIGYIPSPSWRIRVLEADTFWIPSDKPGLAALLEFKRR